MRIFSFLVGRRRVVAGGILVLALSFSSPAQEATPTQSASPAPQQQTAASPASSDTSSSGPTVRLVLGAGDEGDISVYGVPDLTQKFRVDTNGMISLALVG